MSLRRKALIGLAGLVAIFSVSLVIVATWGKGRAEGRIVSYIDEIATERLGGSGSAAGSEIVSPFLVRIHEVTLRLPLSANQECVIESPELNATLNPLRLLSRVLTLIPTGDLTVERVFDERAIEDIRLGQGTARIIDRKDTLLKIQNIAAQFSPRGRGRISADTAILADLPGASRIRATVELDSTAILIPRLSAHVLGGSIESRAEISLPDGRIRLAPLQGRRIDIAQAYALQPSPKGSISGKVSVDLSLEGPKAIVDSLSGSGSADFSDLTLKETPLQKTLVMALFLPSLSTVSFDRAHAEFRIQKGRDWVIDTLWGTGDPLEIRAGGYVDSKGRIDMRLEGILSEGFVKSLAPVTAKSLDQLKDGRSRFYCRIRGTLDNPRVQLDTKTMGRALSNAFENAREEIKKFFR